MNPRRRAQASRQAVERWLRRHEEAERRPWHGARCAAIYLVSFYGHAVLIDAGSGRATDKLVMNIEASGVKPEDIEFLLITHCHFDHTGGARSLRDRFGFTVVMSRPPSRSASGSTPSRRAVKC